MGANPDDILVKVTITGYYRIPRQIAGQHYGTTDPAGVAAFDQAQYDSFNVGIGDVISWLDTDAATDTPVGEVRFEALPDLPDPTSPTSPTEKVPS